MRKLHFVHSLLFKRKEFLPLLHNHRRLQLYCNSDVRSAISIQINCSSVLGLYVEQSAYRSQHFLFVFVHLYNVTFVCASCDRAFPH